MKLAIAAVLAACAPSLGFALVGISWSIANVPSTGLINVTFPFNIANAPHKSGYYFAQQFNFIGQSNVGYTGLQPRPDAEGKPVIHAVFSSFIKGTTTDDLNCHPGADGDPGVSCTCEFSEPYNTTYKLEVANTQGTTWTGTVIDAVTDRRIHIGSWTLPAGTQGLKGSQEGFVEYYPWNAGSHTCSSLPNTMVTFGFPTTTTVGATGKIGDAYEYGDCVGKVAFKSNRTSTGVEVSVGF